MASLRDNFRDAFTVPEPVARGELHPLRDPAAADEVDEAALA